MKNMKSMLFKILGIVLALSLVLTLTIGVPLAQTYPTKPIRLIISFAPGGGNDIVGRMMATKLSERLGKQVVPENHAGGGGIIGTEMVAKADPDGYTLLFPGSAFTILPSLYKTPYDPLKSFTPVAFLVSLPFTLAVHPSVPATSVKELIALAKQKPGQLIFVCAGNGSNNHISTELFRMMADIDFKIVQFKGGGPSIVDLLGGHSHASICSSTASMPYIKSGKLRPLGTTGTKRSIALPDIPTIAEAGVPGFRAIGWFGILAPAGMPLPIVDRLNKEIEIILALDEVKKVFLNIGAQVDYMASADFGQFLSEDITRWADVIKKANINLKE
jgi:tripartite-type tricarboxylate transporter receptor subunit TctC